MNAVFSIETNLAPASLLAALHAVEKAFGRRRAARNAPRTLDLDLIAYNDVVSAGAPMLPHPRAFDRDFVLAPLAEIAPDWRPPESNETASERLAAMTDRTARRIS